MKSVDYTFLTMSMSVNDSTTMSGFIVNWDGPFCVGWYSQFASVADFVYGHAPHRVFTLKAVGRPLILSIKTIRTNITHQHCSRDPLLRRQISGLRVAGVSKGHFYL